MKEMTYSKFYLCNIKHLNSYKHVLEPFDCEVKSYTNPSTMPLCCKIKKVCCFNIPGMYMEHQNDSKCSYTGKS